MRAQLSNRDYEQLSAYIDGQLAQSERRRLEERIHNQPELQNALDELTQTRALIRQAPHRHAPRNFTLTPEMIGEANLRRKRSRGGWNFNLFPILSFTSALAALALVAVLIFQLLPGAQKTGMATAMQPAAAPQSAPLSAQDTASAESAGGASGATGSAGGAVGAEPMTKAAAEPTQAANAAGAAPAAAAPAATQPAALAAAPSGAAAKAADSSAAGGPPPVVAWNGAPPFGAQATGMGGGGGDGSGPGPQQGSLLGPPAANDTYGSVPSGQQVMGMGGGGGGGGGGATGTSPLSVPLNLPAESVNSLENNDAARAANPPAAVNNNIQGAGPILGIAQAGQAGQIVEQRSLVGSPNEVTPQATTQTGESATPGNQIFMPGISNGPDQGASQPESPAPAGVSLPVIEGLLALIALVCGGAAFYLWRRKR